MAKTFLQGLFGDEEEGIPVEQPEAAAGIQNPMVLEHLQKLRGGQYSNDARQALVDKNAAEASAPNVGGALLSLLDGVAGSTNADDLVKKQAESRAERLKQFDMGRSGLDKDAELNMKLRDDARGEDVFARESDPNSVESKAAQALAQKMGMSPDLVKGLTAEKWKALSPTTLKMYEIEQRKLDRSDARLARNEERNARREERLAERAEGAGKRAFDNLPEEKKRTITGLAQKNVDKEAIANSIDAVMNSWDKWDDDERLQQGRQLIKVLNSTQGSDAVGAEEAKRLAGKLQFAMGNLTNDNPIQFGRDLEGFKRDAMNTSKTIKDSVVANNRLIDQAYGRESPRAQDETKVVKGVTYRKVPGGWEEVPSSVAKVGGGS